MLPVLYAEMASRLSGQNDWHAGGNNYIIAFAHVLGRQPRLLLVYTSIEDNLSAVLYAVKYLFIILREAVSGIHSSLRQSLSKGLRSG